MIDGGFSSSANKLLQVAREHNGSTTDSTTQLDILAGSGLVHTINVMQDGRTKRLSDSDGPILIDRREAFVWTCQD